MQISFLFTLTSSLAFAVLTVETFSPIQYSPRTLVVSSSTTPTTTRLFAATKKKSKKKVTNNNSIGGFGGASMAPCPCGSSESYSKCCGKLHRDARTFKSATAEQVARARYSAFAQKQPDFLMSSTHPLNTQFNLDLKAWKDSIKLNMYDKFDMPQCFIVEESYSDDGKKAVVQFIAKMILKETGEATAFMETANFERFKTNGAAPWLYLNGTIATVPDDYARENNINIPLIDEENEQEVEQKDDVAAANAE
mmetsp:Transcript_8445/g.11111  ORF Transcript_8445/g.11111 Transcript_8445/m.11111 type:complete len:252 (+) Transcript_8445:70-825(+)